MKCRDLIYPAIAIATCVLTVNASAASTTAPFTVESFKKMNKDEIKNSLTSPEQRDAFIDWAGKLSDSEKRSELEKVRDDILADILQEGRFLSKVPGTDRNDIASLNRLKNHLESSAKAATQKNEREAADEGLKTVQKLIEFAQKSASTPK